MSNIRHAQITGLVLFYLIAAGACFLSDLPNINSYQWNIDYSIWGTNQNFLDTIAIWSNLLFLSIAPAIFAVMLRAKRGLVLWALALPLFWAIVMLLALYQDADDIGRIISDFAKAVYGILFVSIIGVSIKLYFILKKIREEKKIELLEKFQERALKKLEKLNPEHNQQLMEEVLGNAGKAINLLMAANFYENDDDMEKKEIIRLALFYARMEKKSIEKLKKRMVMYSKLPQHQDG